MKDIEAKEVIISNLLTRGNGVDIPFRKILQVFEKDGTLIAENDSVFNGKDPYMHPYISEMVDVIIKNVTDLNKDKASNPQIKNLIEDGFVIVLDTIRGRK